MLTAPAAAALVVRSCSYKFQPRRPLVRVGFCRVLCGMEDGVQQRVRERLINLENERKLDSLTVVELRGIMKQISRSTKGTKKTLLLEVSKFLHSENVTAESLDGEKSGTKRVYVEQESKLIMHKKVKSNPAWVAYDPATMRPRLDESAADQRRKIISWNVNGLRALLRKDDEMQQIDHFARTEDFDVICLQETKLQEKDVNSIKSSLLMNHSNSFWACSTSKLGYSGCAIISRIKPLSVTFGLGNLAHDGEGRLITAEFDDFFLVTTYVPNSGQKLERLDYRTKEWDPAFGSYLMELQTRKPVIVTGDLNCAHQEIDIHDPDRNRRSAGFTDEERSSFEANLLSKGLVDTFRKQHPNAVGYTYWNYRTNARRDNKGWRLDYFLVSEGLLQRVADSYIVPHMDGSDHCPVGLILSS